MLDKLSERTTNDYFRKVVESIEIKLTKNAKELGELEFKND
jgi:hypothetical protein